MVAGTSVVDGDKVVEGGADELPDPETAAELEDGPWLEEPLWDGELAELLVPLGLFVDESVADGLFVVCEGVADGESVVDGGVVVVGPGFCEGDGDGLGLGLGLGDGDGEAAAVVDGDDESDEVSLSFCRRSKSPSSSCALANARRATRAIERYSSIFEVYMLADDFCLTVETVK